MSYISLDHQIVDFSPKAYMLSSFNAYIVFLDLCQFTKVKEWEKMEVL